MMGRPYLSVWTSYFFFPEVLQSDARLSCLRLSNFKQTDEGILWKEKFEGSLMENGSLV